MCFYGNAIIFAESAGMKGIVRLFSFLCLQIPNGCILPLRIKNLARNKEYQYYNNKNSYYAEMVLQLMFL